jgi:hypothetical protein
MLVPSTAVRRGDHRVDFHTGVNERANKLRDESETLHHARGGRGCWHHQGDNSGMDQKTQVRCAGAEAAGRRWNEALDIIGCCSSAGNKGKNLPQRKRPRSKNQGEKTISKLKTADRSAQSETAGLDPKGA